METKNDHSFKEYMQEDQLFISMGWVLYFAVHSITASRHFKSRIAKLGLNMKYYRLLYNLFAFAGLILLLAWQFQLPLHPLWQSPNWLNWTGYGISGIGFIIMLICLREYFYGMSGIKDLFRNPGTEPLRQDGLHRLVRHPLYLGTFMLLWGLVPAFPYTGFLIFNGIAMIYTFIGIHFEEKKLLETFGDAYDAYRRKVPMILPRFRDFFKKTLPS